MNKINTDELEELTWSSPSGKFGGAGKHVSEALGRDHTSSDVMKRHPFDVEIQRLAPGKISCPFHVHTHQWEFYHVISGRGYARDDGGEKPIGPGDAFLFKPGEPHTIGNDGDEDLILYVVADNPMSEAGYYHEQCLQSLNERGARQSRSSRSRQRLRPYGRKRMLRSTISRCGSSISRSCPRWFTRASASGSSGPTRSKSRTRSRVARPKILTRPQSAGHLRVLLQTAFL